MGRVARSRLNALGVLREVLELEQQDVEAALHWSTGKLSRLEHGEGPRSRWYRADVITLLTHYELDVPETQPLFNMLLMLVGLAHELQAPDEVVLQAAAAARKCDPNVAIPVNESTLVLRPRSFRPGKHDQQRIARQVVRLLLRDHPTWQQLVA